MLNSTGVALSELLVADGTCPKIRELLATSQVPVLWLDSHKEPLIAVSQALEKSKANGSPVQTLHWVSHGAPGTLFVGKTTINTKALLHAQQQLASWQLNTIALWSCSTGADHDFITVLEELTGSTVWASNQLLGRMKDGSRSWQLKSSRRTKAPNTAPDLPINASQPLAWNHQLGGFTKNTPIAGSKPGFTPHEYRNRLAFAALKDDGSVITWGSSWYGGDSSSVSSSLTSGVSQIFSANFAFAALKTDGSVITWGDISRGGDSSSVSSSLTSGVSQIFSAATAFAALKTDGSVITWGGYTSGGDSSSVSSSLSSGVSQIVSSSHAFAALKNDGSVITWGASNWGGNSSAVADSLTSGVSQILSTSKAFSALKTDGSVITWGHSDWGGDSSSVSSSLSSGVSKIFSNTIAFAALKTDGSVITWGHSDYGGNSSSVDLSSGVSQVFSTSGALAALKTDGSVITWGHSDWGGNSSAVADSLTSGISQIFSNDHAFAALKTDGSVITWGDSGYGGDSSSVSSSLSSGVSKIFSNSMAFAALKTDGSVITWGYASEGGDSSAVASSLASGVVGFANPFTNDIYFPGPIYASAATSTDGTKVILTYDETLSSTTAAKSAFSVTSGGVANTVTAVAISGSTVELTLSNTIYTGEAVTVAYTDPTAGDDANAIQDGAGNDASSLSSTAVTNSSTALILYLQSKLKKTQVTASLTLAADSLSQSIRSNLNSKGISLASKVVQLTHSLPEKQTETNLNLKLATIAPNLNLAGSNGKRSSSKKFLFYNINDQGALSSLLYNPITRTGAGLYDTNGDGIGDFLSIAYRDGNTGDNDAQTNGSLSLKTTAATIDLNPVFSGADSTLLKLADAADSATAAAVNFKATLTSRSKAVQSIGYIILSAAETKDADTILTDLDELKQRAVSLFSTLEASDVTLHDSFHFHKSLQLLNGQSIRFFSTADARLSDLTNLSDSRFSWLDHTINSDGSLSIRGKNNIGVSLSQQDNDPGLASLIAQKQDIAPLLDFTAFTAGQTLSGTIHTAREADFDSVIGFYRSVDAAGTVLAADGSLIAPGQDGYADAALLDSNRVTALDNLSVADNKTKDTSFSLTEFSYLAPYAKVTNTETNKTNTFFAFAGANPDQLPHFQALGENLFGLEDSLGGGDRDYDDFILGFNFKALTT